MTKTDKLIKEFKKEKKKIQNKRIFDKISFKESTGLKTSKGKEANGLAYLEAGTSRIEIDKELKSKEYLTIAIHELEHLFFPNMSEKRVKVSAELLGKSLWQLGYRKTIKLSDHLINLND